MSVLDELREQAWEINCPSCDGCGEAGMYSPCQTCDSSGEVKVIMLKDLDAFEQAHPFLVEDPVLCSGPCHGPRGTEYEVRYRGELEQVKTALEAERQKRCGTCWWSAQCRTRVAADVEGGDFGCTQWEARS